MRWTDIPSNNMNTGSRRDNPYSYSHHNNRTSITWKIYKSLSPKVWCALAIIVVIWFITLVFVVEENPEIRREVLTDIEREETIIQSKIIRSKLRAKEWLNCIHHENESSISSKQKHPWELSQLEDLALRVGPNDSLIHIVFSTDCSPYQHWQSYMFFVAALRSE